VSLLNVDSDFDLIAQRTAAGSPIPVRDRVGGAKFEKCLRHPARSTQPGQVEQGADARDQ
jgi:hypothetical protein